MLVPIKSRLRRNAKKLTNICIRIIRKVYGLRPFTDCGVDNAIKVLSMCLALRTSTMLYTSSVVESNCTFRYRLYWSHYGLSTIYLAHCIKNKKSTIQMPELLIFKAF